MKKIKLSFLILMLSASCIVKATDYYISTSGNNSNNGTTSSTPWQTLSKLETVCNNGTIKAGDNIYFKKGDVFTGTLMMTSLWGHVAKSGTASQPITFSTYGTGAKPIFQYPQGSSVKVEDRYLMWFAGVDYIVVDGLNFTDLVSPTNNKVSPATCGFPIYLGAQYEANTNHCTIKNVDVSLCGMGIAILGDFNTVSNCSLTNFKNLKSTSGGEDDFGANAVTISGNDNQILNNTISGAWAYSSDYGWNGGACEMYSTCDRNKFMYNTISDCEGVSEYGGETGSTANDNMIAYNKIINCGELVWINTTGDFAIQVSNLQVYNNVVVENDLSRFSGPNTGSGNSSPQAQYPATELFAFSGSPSAGTVFSLKNNIYILSTGIDVVRSSCVAKTVHQDNIYKLTGAGTPNFTLASSELSTSAAILANTTAADPLSWNYAPATGSPAIDFGQNLGLTKDFAGNVVPSVPNAGILETASAPPALTVTSTSGVINCNAGTTSVTVTASGGTAPYTGTGSFTVGAGTYTYTVTDAAGTVKTTSITVTQPTAITVTATSGTILVFGGNTTVTVTATGGTSPYTYSINGGAFQSLNSFTGILAGTQSITVKDARGCTGVKSLTITQPGATNPLTVTATQTTIACNGATSSVVISASGGTAPYTGTGTFTVNAGTYNYSVIDATGAIKNTTVTVTQPTVIVATVVAPDVATVSARTTATVTASGGTPGYTYALDAGSYQSGNAFTNVAVGTHSTKIKDSKGCIQTVSFTVSVKVAVFTLSLVSKTDVTCRGNGDGTITVAAAGGTGPYTYKRDNGTYTSNPLFTHVRSGAHTITGKDATGATSSVTVTILASQITCTGRSSGTENEARTKASVTEESEAITGLKITAYPNPSSTQFSLIVQGDSNDEISITVMNMNGQKVYENTSNVNTKNSFGSSFLSGMYLVKVVQGTKVQIVKIIKTK